MKHQVFLMALLCGWFYTARSQDSAFIYNARHYKKGIYKTFREFQANNPSQEGQLVLKNKSVAAQVYLLAARNELHIIDSTGREHKVKDYWGFSDGQAIYIKDNGLNRLQSLGYYCLYRVKAVSSRPSGYNNNGIAFNNTPPASADKKVLNIVTGEVLDLTLYNLRRYLLVSDKDLMAEFNADRNKQQRMEYYIQKFNMRNAPAL